MSFWNWFRPDPPAYRGLRLSAADGIPEAAFFNHVLCLGQSGSGKSSGPMHHAISFLAARRRPPAKNWGLFFTIVKPDDVASALAYAQAAGRADDVVLWDRATPFDFLAYDLTGPGASPQRASRTLAVALELVSRAAAGSGGEDKFWMLLAERMILFAVTAVWHATGTCSIRAVQDFVTGLPANPDTVADADWAARSYCARTLRAAAARRPGNDLDLAAEFALAEWPSLSPRTQGSALTSVLNITTQFLVGETAGMVAAGRVAVSPDDVLAGKIVIPDFPMLRHGAPGPGQFVQCIFKTLLQQRAQARDVDDDTAPAAIIADECHYSLVASADLMALTTCRGARLAHVCATQGLPACFAQLGGTEKARHEFEGYAAQFQHKVFCANNCRQTNDWASALCGTHRELLFSGQVADEPHGPLDDWLGRPAGHAGFGEQVQPRVPPHQFGLLRTGGPPDNTVEALVHASGRVFANGLPFTRATFRQPRRGHATR